MSWIKLSKYVSLRHDCIEAVYWDRTGESGWRVYVTANGRAYKIRTVHSKENAVHWVAKITDRIEKFAAVETPADVDVEVAHPPVSEI